MKLIIGNYYHIYIFDDYILKIKLLKIINRANSHYEWQHEDGRIFSNREVDVQGWITKKQIKEII